MVFGWVSQQRDPPECWDLRRLGWRLCHGTAGCRAECRHVLLVDTRGLCPIARGELAEADGPAWRLLMIGVEEPSERARLLSAGVAEATGADVALGELEARARRVDEMFGRLPRWRRFGGLVLDLFHRDARRDGRWLALHPREFGVLWRLADAPGQRVTRKTLLADVWRLAHEPETNSVEVHVSRLRTKLALAGLGALVQTHPDGGYRLIDEEPLVPLPNRPGGSTFDACLHKHAFWAPDKDPVTGTC